MMQAKKQTPLFEIVGFEQSEDGTYTGLITKEGFTLQFKDGNGKPIPLNKEAIEQHLNKGGDPDV